MDGQKNIRDAKIDPRWILKTKLRRFDSKTNKKQKNIIGYVAEELGFLNKEILNYRWENEEVKPKKKEVEIEIIKEKNKPRKINQKNKKSKNQKKKFIKVKKVINYKKDLLLFSAIEMIKILNKKITILEQKIKN